MTSAFLSTNLWHNENIKCRHFRHQSIFFQVWVGAAKQRLQNKWAREVGGSHPPDSLPVLAKICYSKGGIFLNVTLKWYSFLTIPNTGSFVSNTLISCSGFYFRAYAFYAVYVYFYFMILYIFPSFVILSLHIFTTSE